MTFLTVAPLNNVKGGVMGYVNLNIYVGKTSKKVSDQKNRWSGPGGVEVEKTKHSQTSKSGFFYFVLQIWHYNEKFGPKTALNHIDIGFSFNCRKNWGQLIQKFTYPITPPFTIFQGV